MRLSLRRFATYGPRDAMIVGAVRTPSGALLGALSSLKATELGSHVIQHAVQRSGVPAAQVEEVLFGCVLQAGLGQAPARQAAIRGGLPVSVACTTIHKVCASGTKATMLGAQSIWLGHNNVVVAGGMESMSNAPHLVHVRAGVRFGSGELIDHMQHDGLVDAFDKHAMGVCAEVTAEKMGFTRAEQDRFALQSYARTKAAVESGRFNEEIVPVTVRSKKGDTVVSEDEGFRKVVPERVASLPPAFRKNGTVTAANASSINDGASALVLVSRARCEELRLKPLARIVGMGDAAGAPIDYPTAPALAIPKALAMAGLSAKDIDFWEINEAFAVVVLANLKLLNVSESICNVNGGAVALGHPIGSSGARIIVSLVNILKQNKARYGCAAICNGGGGASSVVIENLQ